MTHDPLKHLPAGPYDLLITAKVDQHQGAGHVYVTDANGRKIMNCWGTPDEKMALAKLVIEGRAAIDANEAIRAGETLVELLRSPEGSAMAGPEASDMADLLERLVANARRPS